MLAIIMNRAKEEGEVGCLLSHLVDGGLSILQYADDIILFMEHDVAKVHNMKLILCISEQLSGLKMNFHKSELLPINLEVEELQPFIEFFQRVIGNFLVKYLGIPLYFDRLRRGLTAYDRKYLE
jgi:hypothetical protein